MSMWMYRLLLGFLNMTLTASLVIIFVLVIRLCIRKLPKIYSYVLWSVVLFRLLCPVTLSSDWSLLGLLDLPGEATEWKGTIEYIPMNIVHTEYPQVQLPALTGENVIGGWINDQLPQGEEQLVADPLEGPVVLATWIWWLGILVLLGYSVVSYGKLQMKLRDAVPCKGISREIYETDRIATAFVLGVFRPRIYLPVGLTERERSYILLHEQIHIRRGDHVTKLLAYLAVCLHWFNPLVWVAYHYAIRDMEMSCDERVMREMAGDPTIGSDYAASLLRLATGRSVLAGGPLAFGEGDTGARIRNVLRYRKTRLWLAVVGTVLVLALGVALLCNPSSDDSDETVSGESGPDMSVEEIEVWEIAPEEWERLELQPGRYETADGLSFFEINGNGRFMFLRHIATSYVPNGTWQVENNVLRLFAKENESYLFELIYVQGENGKELAVRYQGREQDGIVKDGTIYHRNPVMTEEDLAYMLREIYIAGEIYKETDKAIPVEVDESAIRRTEDHFGTEILYAFYEDGIVILQDHEWMYYMPVGIREEEAPTGEEEGTTVSEQPAEDAVVQDERMRMKTLEEAVYMAIMDNNREDESEAYLIRTASYIPLLTSQSGRAGEEVDTITVYAMAMYLVFDVMGEELVELGGNHMPVRIVIAREERAYGKEMYRWVDYWMPEDGSYYKSSIEREFPEEIWEEALDTQRYVQEQQENCREQAERITGLSLAEEDK